MLRTPDIGIDLGNSKFSLCLAGEGIVASEASFLAFQGASLEESRMVAFGDEARAMVEHSHPGIRVVTPMREGIVVDCRLASLLLKKVLNKAGIRPILSKPKTMVAALYGASDIERKAFFDVASCTAASHISIIHEPFAAAHAIPNADIQTPRAQLILDVGDGATEAMIVASGRPILGKSMRFGGNDVDFMLVNTIRKRHGLLISQTEARRIKKELSKIDPQSIPLHSFAAKGLWMEKYLPLEISIPGSDLLGVVEKVSSTVGNFIHSVLEDSLPDISRDLIDNGLYLCGGASKMAGIRDAIERHTQLKVHSFDHPDQTVIRGIWHILNRKRHKKA